MSVKVEITGLKETIEAIKKNDKRVRAGLSVALYQEGEQIMKASRRQCPVEFGVLRASAFVQPPRLSTARNRPSVTMGYGTNYAIYVHERTELRHAAPTKAKYLEDPLNSARRGYLGRLGVRTWANYQRGVRDTMPTTFPPAPRERTSRSTRRVRK